jgi:4-amino-4-deoxy-L-arabinose transferase-like glycosyltransferase
MGISPPTPAAGSLVSGSPAAGSAAGSAWPSRTWAAALALRRPRPELAALIVLAGALNLWALSRNGWANDYYSAAVRSMSSSWHNFLFASLDGSGVMTVDKPPLSLWVQSLSVRVFGYHPLSMLVPQALMGVASVALCYDLVRRRFGRFGGFVAGLALAVTPITVAIARHNNPDALLVLCSVAAVWCAVRALEDGRVRWLVLAGVSVGLGFETKMGVALAVVPGIAAAWLLLAPRGRLRALRELLAGAGAMVVVGGAWPALVELTPASERPWVAGTSDNSVLSLIFGYNGVGRVDGQAGGPAGGGSMFGSTPGPLRLLNSALGGQAGWLLGFAVISGLGILVASRAKRADARTGWLIAVGGAFLTTAVLFSAASGIFHPYYVSLLAPFAAALVGAGAAHVIGRGPGVRIFGPLVLAGGVASELVVLDQYPGQLRWLPGVLIAVGALTALALLAFSRPAMRRAAGGVAMAALLLAPSVWAVDTLGYATSGTFPAGGPASVQSVGGGRFGRFGGGAGARRLGAGGLGRVRLFGGGGGGGSSTAYGASSENLSAGRTGGPPSPPGGLPDAGPGGSSAAGAAGAATGGTPPGPPGRSGFGGGGAGGPFGSNGSLTQVLTYVSRHGGGTVALSSQSSAASAIIAQNANVAGIGGFSGRESNVSVSWLALQVRSGRIRWVLADQRGAVGSSPLPGDTRAGAKAAMTAVARACRAVTLPTSTTTTAAGGSSGTAATGGASAIAKLYDCQGRAQRLLSA